MTAPASHKATACEAITSALVTVNGMAASRQRSYLLVDLEIASQALNVLQELKRPRRQKPAKKVSKAMPATARTHDATLDVETARNTQ